MSYRIGQFRKESGGQYITEISIQKESVRTYLNGLSDQSSYFNDIGFSFEDGGTKFENQRKYFVKLTIKRSNQIQNFQIILRNKNEQNTEEQFLKSFFVPPSINSGTSNQTEDSQEYVIVQIVFNPIVDFDQLVLKLSRTASDYAKMNNDGSAGRIIEVDEEGCKCYQIQNILDSLSGVNEFIKIGVQGPTGLLMCINGEEIRIGPSGLYEIKNGYKVNFMGFVITEEFQNDHFLLDYQY